MTGEVLNGLRVLILEDEFLIAMEVEQLCHEQGAAAVAILRTVEEASALDAATFDMAILDVRVGGRSSIEFAKRLHARRTPFIFASGYDEMDGFFDEFPNVPRVAKPYAASALTDALTAARRQAGAA